MRILFQMYHGGELHDLGIVEGGDVVENVEENFEEWIRRELSRPTTPELGDEEALLEAYDGPHVLAKALNED